MSLYYSDQADFDLSLVIPSLKPLIILDADEVLLEFVKGIEIYAKSLNLVFHLNSYALKGNLREKNTDRVLEAPEIDHFIFTFFSEYADKLTLVPGAKRAIDILSKTCEVVILTNVPSHAAEKRLGCFKNHDINLPLIANTGGKGRMVAELMKSAKSPVFFVDDLASQHTDVKEYAPHCHRIHFVADQRLAKITPKAPDAHIRFDQWDHTLSYLLETLNKREGDIN